MGGGGTIGLGGWGLFLCGGGLVGVACKGVGVGADSNGFGEKRG